MTSKQKFGDVTVGTRIRLECTTGVKITPIVCQKSRDFYAKQSKTPFHDWNFQYEYWDGEKMNNTGLMSLAPDTEVWVL